MRLAAHVGADLDTHLGGSATPLEREHREGGCGAEAELAAEVTHHSAGPYHTRPNRGCTRRLTVAARREKRGSPYKGGPSTRLRWPAGRLATLQSPPSSEKD